MRVTLDPKGDPVSRVGTTSPGPIFDRDLSGKIVATQRGSNFYYYIGDYMGSVLRVINDVQNPVGVARYSYEPYGGTVVHNDSIGNPWRWAGGYHDTSVGLYKFGTRYYRPQIFRFTQQDPKAPNLYKPAALNRWAYAEGDPVNMADPSGQEATAEDWMGFGLASVGLVSTAIGLLALPLAAPVGLALAAGFGISTAVFSFGFSVASLFT